MERLNEDNYEIQRRNYELPPQQAEPPIDFESQQQYILAVR